MQPSPPTVIRLPAPPSPPPRIRVPVAAALAPVAASALLFAATGSALSLVFAALGPVTAVASVVDAVIAAAGHRRRERRRIVAETAAAADRIRRAHDAERAEAETATPSGARIVAADPRAVVGWHRRRSHPMSLAVGTGDAQSALRVEGEDDREELAELAALAVRLERAPVTARADGIGVVGPLPAARAIARGIVVQAVAAIGPDLASIAAAGPAWGRAPELLPHPRSTPPGSGADSTFVMRVDDGEVVRIEVAEDALDLAPTCPAVLELGAGEARLGVSGGIPGGRTSVVDVRPVDLVAFESWCGSLSTLGVAAGTVVAAPPERVDLADLLAARPRGAVAAVIGADAAGAVAIDLAADGPHAVIGGTTGSGKSELLVAWVAAMAAGAAPAELALLLVDFKGGAGFAPVAALPHVVGIVTDLDEAGAIRAVESLRAEVRRREALAAAAGVRELGPETGAPRLVIVVDEYAALVAARPELHDLFADLAARGRSLAIHLIACTQRPSASVRDAVLANADIRICLRVRDRADGIALVGSPRPAELPAHPRGRAVASVRGEPPAEVQIAIADPATIAAIAERWASSPRPRRPWRDPLPTRITRDALAALVEPEDLAPAGLGGTGPAAVIGAVDRPDRQRIEPWTWSAIDDGVLLAVGAPGSGRSGLLAAIAAAAPSIRVPDEPAVAWDALVELTTGRRDHGGATVLIDDLDLLAHRLPAEHRPGFLDLLGDLCRRRRELGVGIAVTAATPDDAVRAIVPHVQTRVLLRAPSRQEHLLAGGAAETWTPDLPPGGAIVDGRRVQVLDAGPLAGSARAPSERRIGDAPLAVVAPSPDRVAVRLGRAGRRVIDLDDFLGRAGRGALGAGTATVADPAAWQARWGAVGALAGRATVVAHGLDAAQLRGAVGFRGVAPPLPDDEDAAWILLGDRAVRTRLPAAVEPGPDTGIRIG